MIAVSTKINRKIDAIIKLLKTNESNDSIAETEVKKFILTAERIKYLINEERITIKYL